MGPELGRPLFNTSVQTWCHYEAPGKYTAVKMRTKQDVQHLISCYRVNMVAIALICAVGELVGHFSVS